MSGERVRVYPGFGPAGLASASRLALWALPLTLGAAFGIALGVSGLGEQSGRPAYDSQLHHAEPIAVHRLPVSLRAGHGGYRNCPARLALRLTSLLCKKCVLTSLFRLKLFFSLK